MPFNNNKKMNYQPMRRHSGNPKDIFTNRMTPCDPNHIGHSGEDKTIEMAKRSVGCQVSGWREGRTQVFLIPAFPAATVELRDLARNLSNRASF